MKNNYMAVWSLILSLCVVPSLNAGIENGEDVQSVEPVETSGLIEKAVPNLVLLGGVAFSVQQAMNGNWSLATSVLTSLGSAAAAYAIYATSGWSNQKESAPQVEEVLELKESAELVKIQEAVSAHVEEIHEIDSPEILVQNTPIRVPSDDSLSLDDEPEDVFEAAPKPVAPPLLRFSVEIPQEIIDARKIKNKKKRPNKPLVGAENKKPNVNAPEQKSEAHAPAAPVVAAEPPEARVTDEEIVELFDAALGKGFSDRFLFSLDEQNLDRSLGVINPQEVLRNLYDFLGPEHIERPRRFLLWHKRTFYDGLGAGLTLEVPFALKSESGILLVKFSEEFLNSILGFRDVQGHFIDLDTLRGISSKALKKWRSEDAVRQIRTGESSRFTNGYQVNYMDVPYVVVFGYEKAPRLITAYKKAS